MCIRDSPGTHIENKCLHIEVIEADEKIAQFMLCEQGTPIYYIERLRRCV